MVRIEFTDEPLIKAEPGESGRVGLLVLGQHEERFVAHTQTWSEAQYVQHWHHALNRVLDGKRSALITDMRNPAESSHLVWWPMWKNDHQVVFHNQLLFFETHGVQGTRVDVDRLYGVIGERQSRNAEGTPVSEWIIPVLDVQKFLLRE